jgi:hypothetical protein
MDYNKPFHTEISISINGEIVFKENVFMNIEDAQKKVQRIAEERYPDKECHLFFGNSIFGGGSIKKINHE